MEKWHKKPTGIYFFFSNTFYCWDFYGVFVVLAAAIVAVHCDFFCSLT
jgi:hypothetical protein